MNENIGKGEYSVPTRGKKIIATIAFSVVIAILLIVTVFPIYWMILTSFKGGGGTGSPEISFFPRELSYLNYKAVFFPKSVPLHAAGGGTTTARLSQSGFVGISNSLIIAGFATILSLAIGLLAAYALAKLRFRGADTLAFWLILTRMLPSMTIVIPLFLMMNRLHLVDTKIALIMSYVAFNLPFATWMMRSFLVEIPNEMNESAVVDGCGHLQILTRILFPLILPGIIVTGIYIFMFCMNDFLFALVLTRFQTQTFPVQISSLTSVRGIEYGAIAAFGIAGSIPTLMLAVFTQKYLVRGLTYGAVKG